MTKPHLPCPHCGTEIAGPFRFHARPDDVDGMRCQHCQTWLCVERGWAPVREGSFCEDRPNIRLVVDVDRYREVEAERDRLREASTDTQVALQEALGLLSDTTTMDDIEAEVRRLKAAEADRLRTIHGGFFGTVRALKAERDRLRARVAELEMNIHATDVETL